MGVIAEFADMVSVREDALRLLISILAGYPLAALHRTFFYSKSAQVQHCFFVAAGILIYLFNCGIAIYHSLLSIGIAYLIVNYIPGTPLSVALAHICFFGHILVGYSFEETHNYDITWTTPFCIMTLRFIGLVMDVFDGHKLTKKASKSDTAITDKPGLLEIAAYGMFFAGTLVGPQFPLRRFRAFVNGEYLDEKKREVRESSIMASLQRFVAGVFFAVIHQWGNVWVPDTYLNSTEFLALPFYWKVFWNTVWFRVTMYRYCIVWLLTEGAAILSGLAYNGKDANGDDRWDGVRDIHLIKFELGSDFQSVIDSFNCGTNNFAKQHIFKRLKWMGNKYYSHLGTLFFLAMWHGYHLGYFLLFAFEFMCMVVQEQLYTFIKLGPSSVRNILSQWWMHPFCWLFGRITINTSMAFAFLTFGLVKKEIWIVPLKSMYFYGFWIYFIIWPLIFRFMLRPLIRKTGTTKRDENGSLEYKEKKCVPPHKKSPVLSTPEKEVTKIIWDKNISHSEVIVSGFGADITRKDLLTLSDTEWLNDEVINFYINMIVERNQQDPNLPKIHAFNTFFYQKLCQAGFPGVKRWTQKVDIFFFQMLIIPIYLANHWCMAIVDFHNKRVDYYDSLLVDNQACLEIIKNYLIDESEDKKDQPFDSNNWTFNCLQDIPCQQNPSDCGVFACMFAEYASRRAFPIFEQQHIPYFRQRMVYEIYQKKLL